MATLPILRHGFFLWLPNRCCQRHKNGPCWPPRTGAITSRDPSLPVSEICHALLGHSLQGLPLASEGGSQGCEAYPGLASPLTVASGSLMAQAELPSAQQASFCSAGLHRHHGVMCVPSPAPSLCSLTWGHCKKDAIVSALWETGILIGCFSIWVIWVSIPGGTAGRPPVSSAHLEACVSIFWMINLSTPGYFSHLPKLVFKLGLIMVVYPKGKGIQRVKFPLGFQIWGKINKTHNGTSKSYFHVPFLNEEKKRFSGHWPV